VTLAIGKGLKAMIEAPNKAAYTYSFHLTAHITISYKPDPESGVLGSGTPRLTAILIKIL
jgi:hypothetical protein